MRYVNTKVMQGSQIQVCKQTKKEPVPSDPFRRCYNLRKYDKFIREFRVSIFLVHQATGGSEGVRE